MDKKELEALKVEIDGLIEKGNEAILSKIYSKETIDGIKKEIEEGLKKVADASDEQAKKLDEVNAAIGRFQKQQEAPVTNWQKFNKALKEGNAIESYKKSKYWEHTFSDDFTFRRKVDDMTAANTFTNTVVGPDYRSGIFFDPDDGFSIRQLLPVIPTNSSSTVFNVEGTYTDNTAVTAEGSEFKQGDFDLTATTATVYKTTAYIMLSEEMLDDVDGITSYIYTRLPDKLRLKDNTYCIYGTGDSQIKGITVSAAAWAEANYNSTTVQQIDVLGTGVTQVRVAGYMPNGILLHPTTAAEIRHLKSGSTYPQYFNLQWVIGETNPRIAGVPIYETESVTAGDFIIGDFRRGATIRQRTPISIEMTNVNEDNFIKGMVTIRGQFRSNVENHNPNAFVYDTFTAALAKGSA